MTTLLLKLFIKDYKNVKNEKVRQAYGTLGGLVGIVINIILFAAKLSAGLITGAISVTADAFNNLSDAGSSVITLAGFKIAGKKGDKEHPFGHGRVEYVAGLIVAFIIILVGFELLKSSGEKIISPDDVQFSMLSVFILSGSILAKLWMGLFNYRLGKAINSAALGAVTKDSLSDAAATSAVLVGLIIAKFSGFNPDGYIGVLVACVIIYAGINAARDTLNPLLGSAPDAEFVAEIKETVCAHDSVVIGVHDIIVHDYGPGRCMITLHAEVDGSGDIMKIHDEIDLIENEIRQKFGCAATIHMDPLATDDKFTNELKGIVQGVLHLIDKRLTFHDFRITSGPTHTNLIFDVVAPYEMKLTDEQLIARIKQEVSRVNENYFAVVEIDRDYTGTHG